MRVDATGQKATDDGFSERNKTLRLSGMWFVRGLITLVLLFLIPVGVSLRSSSRSRQHSDSLLVGLFAGSATVGLTSVGVSIIVFFIREVFTTDVRLLAAFGVVIATPAAMIRLTRGWLRR